MDDRLLLGGFAIALGIAAGVVLFVPFVAISYRRRGGLSAGRFVLWAAALVYFMAIWTYTLLPLPDPDAVRCAGVNLDLFAFVADLRGAAMRPTTVLTDPAALQVLLNVLLFIPLGFFVRVIGGRGILVAALVGLGLSGFIELTQLTGAWGLYPCAYRVFDVDDLLTNSLGAVIGSLLSLAVPPPIAAWRARPTRTGRAPSRASGACWRWCATSWVRGSSRSPWAFCSSSRSSCSARRPRCATAARPGSCPPRSPSPSRSSSCWRPGARWATWPCS
nr:hypothetical protein GCM10025699_08110 [Microbacterium flavescens]